MKINNTFVKAEELGKKLADKMVQGYDITVEILDSFGNGRIILEHDDYSTSYVLFEKITPRDEVEIESNGLGTIIRTYEE